MMIKILKNILLACVIIILLVSFLVLLIVNYQLVVERQMLFSTQGFLNYLSTYSKYKELFVASIAATAAYVGLQGLQETVSANRSKIKHDKFTEWKNRIDIRVLEVEKIDPYLRRIFMEKRSKYFDFLYDANFNIVDKKQLILGLAIFAEAIPVLESFNTRAINMGHIYLNWECSYSFDAFRFVFIGATDNYYAEIEADLKAYFILSLRPDRIVNEQMYRLALIDLIPNIL